MTVDLKKKQKKLLEIRCIQLILKIHTLDMKWTSVYYKGGKMQSYKTEGKRHGIHNEKS